MGITFGASARYMDIEGVSLEAFLKDRRVTIYEKAPVPIQRALKRSIWLAVWADVLVLMMLNAVTFDFLRTPASGRFFIIPPTADWLSAVLRFIYSAIPPFMLMLIVSLITLSIVITWTVMLTRPSRAAVHWLMVIALVPTLFTLMALFALIVLSLIIVTVNAAVWLLILVVATFLVLGFFGFRR